MNQELISEILENTPNYTASKLIIERIPHVFNNNLELYINWKQELSNLIGVDSKAIVFTGTSSVGYSFNPTKNFKPFDNQSDIDVAIISSHFFDISWHFLRNLGTKYHRFKPKEKAAIEDHRTRLIYHGTIATDKILHLLPFGSIWNEAMLKMQNVSPTENREINFRIYKDFEALKAYQIISVTKAKDNLLKR